MDFRALRFATIFFLLIFCYKNSRAGQADSSSSVNAVRAAVFYGTVCASVGGLYLFADEAYYNDQTVSFHWARLRNGRLDWFDNYHRGIDKFGHVYSTSLFSQHLYRIARWAGYDEANASWLSAGSALAILSAMEVWDGHFRSWGFSPGDFTADVIGALLPVAQRHIGFIEYIDYKMSYNFLADKAANSGVHDYEHMTFWLTANPAGFFKRIKWLHALRFLNIAAGFGIAPGFPHKQELYIALDYNLKKIKIKNIYLKQLLESLDRFHLPAPAIRIRPDSRAFFLFF